MRRTHWLVILIGVCCGISPIATLADTVRITNGEWPPFTSEHLPEGGPLSRIVAEAFALEGIRVEYGFFPWKRAYRHAMSGEWDGTIGWAPTPDHQRDLHMGEPLIILDKALFHLKDTPFDWSRIEDLVRWRVGGTAGYSYGVEWDRAVQEGWLKVEEVPLDEQNIRKLLLKRIDVVAMEIDVANYLIRTRLSAREAEAITHHPRLLMRTPICIGLSRRLDKSPALLARFNRGLSRLKESGRYDDCLRELYQNRIH